MYAVPHRLDPDTYLALARAVFAEMAARRLTAVGEFHYLHHAAGGRRYDDPNAMGEALISAAREAGIRITLLDTCYLAGGLFAERPRAARRGAGAVLRRHRRGLGRAGRPASPTTTRCGSARRSTRCAPCRATTSRSWARSRPRRPAAARAPLRAARREPRLRGLLRLHADRAARGGGPADAADDGGARHPPVRRATSSCSGEARRHRVLLPDHRARPRRRHRPGPARCTTPGSPLSLGSDQHAVIDPFEEVRGVEMHERLESLERGPLRRRRPARHGHRATATARSGWDDGGVIAAGRLADLVAVRLDSPRTAGCRPGRVLYAATAADVTDVVVAGEHVVRDGRHRSGDVGRAAHRRDRGGAQVTASGTGTAAQRHPAPVLVTGIGELVTCAGPDGVDARPTTARPRPPTGSASSATPRSSWSTGWSPGSGRRPTAPAADRRRRRRRPRRHPRLRRQPQPPRLRRATARRSSPPGWPASPTTAAASASRSRRPGRRATTSCAPCCGPGSPRCARTAPRRSRSRAATG